MDIIALVDEAAELNNKKALLEKDLKDKKDEIKKSGLGSYEGNKYIATVTSKVRQRKLNQAKALEVVNKLGAKWLLTQVVDEEKLEDAIATGEIDGKEFADCVDTSYNTVITFKAKKGV